MTYFLWNEWIFNSVVISQPVQFLVAQYEIFNLFKNESFLYTFCEIIRSMKRAPNMSTLFYFEMLFCLIVFQIQYLSFLFFLFVVHCIIKYLNFRKWIFSVSIINPAKPIINSFRHLYWVVIISWTLLYILTVQNIFFE